MSFFMIVFLQLMGKVRREAKQATDAQYQRPRAVILPAG